MDDTDLRILAHLARSPFASHAELGRVVGRAPSTVAGRLRALEGRGVLRGWVALPDAEVFGRQAIGLGFEADVPLDALLALDDAVYAGASPDGYRGVMGYTSDPDLWRETVEEVVGVPADAQATLPGRTRPAALGPLEWRVLRALVETPRASLKALAAATGLSYRTVKARRTRLVDQGAVAVQPLLRPARDGTLYYHLWVWVKPRADEAAVLSCLPSAFVIDRYDHPRSVYVFCQAADLADQAAQVHALRNAADVDAVRVVINDDFAVATGRLLRWIDEAGAPWGRPR